MTDTPDEMFGLDLATEGEHAGQHYLPPKASQVVEALRPPAAAPTMSKNDSSSIPEAVGKLKHCPSSINMTSVTSKSQLVELLENEARYQQQVTAIFRIRCLEGGKDQLMDWFDRVGQELKKTEGFWGRSIVVPSPGANVWVVIIKFENLACLNAWKASKVRNQLLEEIKQNQYLGMMGIDVDVEEGNLTLIENQDMDVSQLQKALPPSTEPAKWKSFVIIYIGVLIVALPLNCFLKPALVKAGTGRLGSFMLNTMCVVSCLNFVIVPLLSKICRPFMKPWPTKRFDFLMEYEPFITLTLGLPCLRPKESRNSQEIRDLHAEVTSLERLVNEVEHKAHTQRWKLQERLTHVEDGLGTLAKLVAEDELSGPPITLEGNADGRYTVSAVAEPSVAVAIPVETEDMLFSQVQKEKGRLERSHDEVTAVIHYNVRVTHFDEFEDAMHAIASAATKFDGYLNCSLVRPAKGSNEYVVILKFMDFNSLNKFVVSETRRRLRAAMKDLIEIAGEVSFQTARDAIEGIFNDPIAKEASRAGLAKLPQKWKMWTIIVLGIFYINYPFVALWLAPNYGKELGPVICTLIGGAVVVVGLVYVTTPIQLLLFRDWLFAPWKESEWLILRFLQKGFPCL